MKIALFGATGYLGMEILKKSIEEKHQVKVLVRNPQKLGEYADRVEIIQGDYFINNDIKRTLAGSDIVISAIGPAVKKPDNIEEYTSSMIAAMTNLVLEMENTNINKIIWIGGAATPLNRNEAFNLKQKFIKFMLNSTAKYILAIKSAECSILTKSKLKWVIIRPPAITSGSPTKKISADEHKLCGMKIDRDDLVEFIHEQTTSDFWVHKAPLVSSIKR